LGSSNEHILITGGAGYVGAVLGQKLVANNYNVTILDNNEKVFTVYKEMKRKTNLRIIQGDIRDLDIIERSLSNSEYVVHLAAVSDGIKGRENPKLTHEVNFEAFKYFAHKAASSHIKRFIFASTFGVYGDNYKCALNEKLPVDPAEDYSLTKAQGEEILFAYNSEDFVTTSLRMAVVYGFSPNMRFDGIVNKLILHALKTGEITIWGGSQKRPAIHVEDVADFIIKILEAPAAKILGQIFNVGNENISMKELGQLIAENLSNKVRLNFKAGRCRENSFELDSEKIARILNLRPKLTIKNAVRKIEENYRKCYFTEWV